MSAVNWLVEITNSPVEYYSLVEAVDSSVVWDERLIGPPSIRKSMGSPTGGFVNLDDTSITLSNTDGSLSAWINGASDPRGKLIQIYSKDMHDESDVKVLRFAGTIVDVTANCSEQGLSDVTVRASSDSEEYLRSLIPSSTITRSMLTTAAPNGFGVATADLNTEDIDRVIPVVFGATREHFPGILIERSTNVHDYLVCHDATDVFCRASINTAYRVDALAGNRMKVILSSEYTEAQTVLEDYPDTGIDSSFLVASFNTSQTGTVLFDVECNEYDTSRTDVKRHWLFKEGITDSKLGKLLASSTPGNQEGEWLFNSDASGANVGPGTGNVGRDDSSGNSRDLSMYTRTDSSHYDGDNDFFRNSLTIPFTYVSFQDGGTSPEAEFWPLVGDDFHIACRVKTETGLVDTLDGTICYRYDVGAVQGYRCGFAGGYPYLTVTDANGTTTVTSTTNCDDSTWHKVVFNLDRGENVIQIIIDEVVDASASVAGLLTLKPTTPTLPMYLFEHAGVGFGVFYGQCDYIKWHRESYLDTGTYTTGQSGQGDSAISLPTAAVWGEDDSASAITDCDIAGTVDFGIMTWVKLTDANNVIYERTNPGVTNGFRLETASSKAKCSIWTNDGTATTVTSTTSIDDGEWHQVWLLRESNTLKVYVDGVSEDTTSDSGIVWASGDDGDIDIMIDGDMDELMIEIGSVLTAAQIRKQYMNAVGAMPRIVQRIIENQTWGLNQATQAQTVDQTTFDDAEDEFFDATRFSGTADPTHPIYVRVAGAVTQQREAVDLMSELLRMYGGVARKLTAGQWEFKFAWEKVNASSHVLGHLDGANDNINRISGYRQTNIDEMPKRLACRYQTFTDPYLQAQQGHDDHRYLSRTAFRDVLSGGGLHAELFDLPFVRDWHSADRIADFIADWKIADTELVVAMSALADVGNSKTALDIEPGDVVTITQAQWGLSASEYRVGAVNISNSDEVTLNCYENTTSVDTYTAHTDGAITDFIPDDSPDYRYTFPLAPTVLELVGQDAGDLGTYVTIRFDLTGGEINEDICREIEIQWFYDFVSDGSQTGTDDGNDYDINRIRLPVTIEHLQDGSTVNWSTAAMEPGRDVTLRVVSLSTYGRESAHAQLLDDPQLTQLQFTVDTVAGTDNPQQTYGSTSTGIPGPARVVALDVSAGAAQATGFAALLPFKPNTTDPNELIIFLSNEMLTETATDPPELGRFLLSGTDNKDVEFYRTVRANETAACIIVPA